MISEVRKRDIRGTLYLSQFRKNLALSALYRIRTKSANRSLIVYNPRARKTLRVCGPFGPRSDSPQNPRPHPKKGKGGPSPLTPLG